MRENTQNVTLGLKETSYNLVKGYFVTKIIIIMMIISAGHDVRSFKNAP